MVVASTALFVSLGGVSYGLATGSIDSREIRNNTVRTGDIRNNTVRGKDIRNSTVRGRDVALNTLTGVDVNESRLGKVPAAVVADSAEGVGGATLRRFHYRANADATPQTVLELGGLVLTGTCPGGVTRVLATTTAPDSYLTSYSVTTSSLGGGGPVDVRDVLQNDLERDPFQPTGAPVNLLPDTSVSSQGHTGYLNAGSTVQLQWTAESVSGGPPCEFAGLALRG